MKNQKIYSFIFILIITIAMTWIIPIAVSADETQKPHSITITGILRVAEKDEKAKIIAMEITELMSDPKQEAKIFRIAAEGKGMELFEMEGCTVKAVGTLSTDEKNQQILTVSEYEVVKKAEEPSKTLPPEEPLKTRDPEEIKIPLARGTFIVLSQQDQPEQPAAIVEDYFGSQYTYEQREDYVKALDKSLGEWKDKLGEVEKKIEKADQQIKEKLLDKFTHCNSIYSIIRQKLSEISSLTEAMWVPFQKDVNGKLTEMETSYKEMLEFFSL